jgi:hypothetical protein
MGCQPYAMPVSLKSGTQGDEWLHVSSAAHHLHHDVQRRTSPGRFHIWFGHRWWAYRKRVFKFMWG